MRGSALGRIYSSINSKVNLDKKEDQREEKELVLSAMIILQAPVTKIVRYWCKNKQIDKQNKLSAEWSHEFVGT